MEIVSHSSDSFQRQMHCTEKEMILNDDCCDGLGGMQIESSTSPCARASVLSAGIRQKFFLAGFRDCRQEVLRYLVDVEQVPLEGPIMFGLEQHLTKLEMLMQNSYEYSDCCNYSHQSEQHNRSHEQCSANDGAAVSSIPAEEYFQEQNLSSHLQSPPPSPKCDEINSHNAVGNEDGFHQQNNSFDSGCDSSLVSSSANSSTITNRDTALSPSQSPNNIDLQDSVSESELAENAVELMRLAHNNPNISRILNELFVLMDDDYDDDDEDDDGLEMDEENDDDLNSES